MSNVLPDGWIAAPLAELLETFESGSRPKGGVRGIAEGVPSIGGEHLNYNGAFNFHSIKFVPRRFAAAMTKGQIRRNDVLIVKDGATTGKTAFVDASFPFDEAVVNEHVFVCRPFSEIEPRFLFRYLMSKEGQARILENFKGSAQGGINQSFASNTEVPLAPNAEQQRIVVKLEKLLPRVEASQKRLAKIPVLLKRFRQSVLAAACSGRLTADWRKSYPSTKAISNQLLKADVYRHAKVTEENEKAGFKKYRYKPAALIELNSSTKGIDELFELPKNWEWASLGQLTWAVSDGPHFSPNYVEKNEGIPFISGRNVFYHGIDFSDAKYVSKKDHEEFSKRSRPLVGDVLLTKGGTTGIATVVPEGGEFSIWVHVALLKVVNELVSPYYLRDVLTAPFVYAQSQAQTHGIGNQDLGLTRMVHIALPLPPLSEQEEIVRRVKELFALADKIETRHQKAHAHVDKLMQSILAKAYRGELVPQDPNDEPAEELLKRIKK